jgi:hypothetical protein
MRTNPILIVTAIAIASLGVTFYFLRDDTLPKQTEATKPVISSTSTLSMTNPPIGDKHRDQPANPDQRQLTLMNDRIADLEARLRDMEATASEHAQDETVARPNESEANKDTEKEKTKRLSESDFGHWMDKALDTGDFNRDATQSVMDQMAMSLTEAPGINLTEMQCGERFCRASFVSDNGKPPKITQLIGASPFIESGFTINEPDGRVRVYFTQPGQALSELRSEAQESILGDMHLK